MIPEGTAMKQRPKFHLRPPPRTSTSRQHTSETSFIPDTPSEKIYTSKREQEIDEILANRKELEEEVLRVFPEIKKNRLVQIRRNEYGQIVINEGHKNSIDHVIIDVDGEAADIGKSRFPAGIRKDLGRTNVQINNEEYAKQLKEEEEQAERVRKHEEAMKAEAENAEELQDAKNRFSNLQGILREQLEARKKAGSPEEVEDADRNITRTRKSIKTVGIEVENFTKDRDRLERTTIDAEARVVEGERQVESARSKVNERLLSLRDRLREIFKKYGFTAFAVLTAVGMVIGVIVSNLKAGLTKVAKGVGNGLKELGAKLSQILPGMVGAIASFIFRTAGEVVRFLAKNAWLLVVGLVLLAVEQLKNKRK